MNIPSSAPVQMLCQLHGSAHVDRRGRSTSLRCVNGRWKTIREYSTMHATMDTVRIRAASLRTFSFSLSFVCIVDRADIESSSRATGRRLVPA